MSSKNQLPLTPPEPEEDSLDFSDTEIELARILRTFTVSKTNDDNVLSSFAIENIEKVLPFRTEVRLQRSSKENIRIISSRMTHYLFSHEFQVSGSTGKNYTVQIGSKLNCTCRDHKTRGTHCKHILYILLQELKVTDLTSKIYITLFPTDELLKDVFTNYHT